MQKMAMAYAVSKEKKREVITKMITELCVSDVNSIVKKEERLRRSAVCLIWMESRFIQSRERSWYAGMVITW